MNYCFDIDDTICNTPKLENGKPGYLKATPIPFMVEQVNRYMMKVIRLFCRQLEEGDQELIIPS